ncbi:MAG: formyltransferase family protein [Actinobacteria bacterium]|nr:formyltransferase family protein [Actinomycetota bacterium]
MARVVVIGGIESTFRNASVLQELGDEVLALYTRGPSTPGWAGVDPVDESLFQFKNGIRKIIVETNINDCVPDMLLMKPDFIYSFGWQQIYSQELLSVAPVIGIHESLLPRCAGPVPIANAILHGENETGCTLFWVDGGMDTGPIIGQLKNTVSPLISNSTEIYAETMDLGEMLLRMYVPHINSGRAPRIEQNQRSRSVYGLVDWSMWDDDILGRARVYPYA